jgi:hypothetical protein
MSCGGHPPSQQAGREKAALLIGGRLSNGFRARPYLDLTHSRYELTLIHSEVDEEETPKKPTQAKESAGQHLKILGDQKNYLEELNRHLEAKLKDVQGDLRKFKEYHLKNSSSDQ